MKKNYFLLLFILLISWLPSLAQTYKIQGSVIDKRTREPLEFVNVLVVGLNSGASTDSEGNFTIEQVPPGIYRLQASSLGYKTVLTPEYRVNHITPHVQIEMEEDELTLDAVTIHRFSFP